MIKQRLQWIMFIFLIAGNIFLAGSFDSIKAQTFLPLPYSYCSMSASLPYFYPWTTFQCRLISPFAENRFAPLPLSPSPILAQSSPAFRRAATTTLLTPSALLASPTSLLASPTSLLFSLLFSPLPTTTTVTPVTGTTPNSISTNPTASPTLTLKRLTTTTTTPILPGLTSLFLPLLI